MSMINFVFDVESIGLHGEAFAVGYTVVNDVGVEADKGIFACPRELARGTFYSRDWVDSNVPLLDVNCDTPLDVRTKFWSKYMEWKENGATFWSDCSWPVEARFLIACIEDDHANREWKGPYPLHDVATVLLMAGFNPLEKFPRVNGEVEEHNPLHDARQSARLLTDAFVQIFGARI